MGTNRSDSVAAAASGGLLDPELERLLDAVAAGDPQAMAAARRLTAQPPGLVRLADLLAAASAPASAAELAGEHAAVVAFRSARSRAVGQPSARPTWARLLTIKAGAVALALAAGGVALAAGTGMLPPLGGEPPADPASVPASRSTLTSTTAPAGPDGPGGGSASASPTGPPGEPPASASALLGLCVAYLAPGQSGQAKPELDGPAFAALAAAAGGPDAVAGFCASLVAQHDPTQRPSPSHPSPSPPTPSGAPAAADGGRGPKS